ncbi:acetyl-CoA acyltransferase [Actinocorallia herbida]|uniref:Acetyl-CoA acyltransferase n=1 Tax=Actinocorallia herbida TaxID=58109 RepID=A0A3N1D0L5_9ACTN|nr:thiolase family protein [Actinocorallia herbida]ROO87064.1 acetyl-CoA acyltransferase [Actinocorallia herbida]
MTRAVIVDAVRTAGGRRGGRLSGWHPAELAAETLRALESRTGLDPALIDDVIMGCVTQVGAQSTNIGRSAVLAAGWPESVPATTVDRQCGSSQQALHFAAQGVVAGAYDVVVAAGVECMSTVPMFSNAAGADPYGDAVHARYAGRESFGETGLVPQGVSAELVAERWGLTREELDAFGLRSQVLAAAARDAGRFADEIVPVQVRRRNRETGAVVVEDAMATEDEGIRETTAERLAALKPAFLPEGRVTAGNSSQITDGASAVLVMSEERCLSLGLRPRAVVAHGVLAAADPVLMLTAPIPATRRLLARAGLVLGDIDRFEVNEAFAPVVLAWQRELGADLDRVNVNGGGIALGHPLGASGTKLTATLLGELERSGGRYGLLTMCEGGGMANATLIERWT